MQNRETYSVDLFAHVRLCMNVFSVEQFPMSFQVWAFTQGICDQRRNFRQVSRELSGEPTVGGSGSSSLSTRSLKVFFFADWVRAVQCRSCGCCMIELKQEGRNQWVHTYMPFNIYLIGCS